MFRIWCTFGPLKLLGGAQYECQNFMFQVPIIFGCYRVLDFELNQGSGDRELLGLAK